MTPTINQCKIYLDRLLHLMAKKVSIKDVFSKFSLLIFRGYYKLSPSFVMNSNSWKGLAEKADRGQLVLSEYQTLSRHFIIIRAIIAKVRHH
jgi:hypothetical protein